MGGVEHGAPQRLVALQQEVGGAAQMRELPARALGGRHAVQPVDRGQPGQLGEHLPRGGGASRQDLGRLAPEPPGQLVPVAGEMAPQRVELAQGAVLGREEAVVAQR